MFRTRMNELHCTCTCTGTCMQAHTIHVVLTCSACVCTYITVHKDFEYGVFENLLCLQPSWSVQRLCLCQKQTNLRPVVSETVRILWMVVPVVFLRLP